MTTTALIGGALCEGPEGVAADAGEVANGGCCWLGEGEAAIVAVAAGVVTIPATFCACNGDAEDGVLDSSLLLKSPAQDLPGCGGGAMGGGGSSPSCGRRLAVNEGGAVVFIALIGSDFTGGFSGGTGLTCGGGVEGSC